MWTHGCLCVRMKVLPVSKKSDQNPPHLAPEWGMKMGFKSVCVLRSKMGMGVVWILKTGTQLCTQFASERRPKYGKTQK